MRDSYFSDKLRLPDIKLVFFISFKQPQDQNWDSDIFFKCFTFQVCEMAELHPPAFSKQLSGCLLVHTGCFLSPLFVPAVPERMPSAEEGGKRSRLGVAKLHRNIKGGRPGVLVNVRARPAGQSAIQETMENHRPQGKIWLLIRIQVLGWWGVLLGVQGWNQQGLVLQRFTKPRPLHSRAH